MEFTTGLLIGVALVAAATSAANAITAALPITVEDQLRAQLRTERSRHHHEATALRARLRSTITTPDAEAAMRLAGIAYGVDWRSLRACALSEGYRTSERHTPTNNRRNRSGSGAVGAWQFMPSTYAGTPQGRAGLPITRVDAQAHAAAWMWAHGRRREWTGAGC